MSITITKVTGIGGNPPTQIQIEGTISNCENGFVAISECSSQTVVPIDFNTATPIPGSPGTRSWSLIYTNDRGCHCGDEIKVAASCTLGMRLL